MDSSGDYVKSIEMYQIAIDTFREMFGFRETAEDYSDMAEAQCALGQAHRRLGNTGTWLELVSNSIDLWEKASGGDRVNHEEFCKCLRDRANYFVSVSRHEEAKIDFDKAIEVALEFEQPQ